MMWKFYFIDEWDLATHLRENFEEKGEDESWSLAFMHWNVNVSIWVALIVLGNVFTKLRIFFKETNFTASNQIIY